MGVIVPELLAATAAGCLVAAASDLLAGVRLAAAGWTARASTLRRRRWHAIAGCAAPLAVRAARLLAPLAGRLATPPYLQRLVVRAGRPYGISASEIVAIKLTAVVASLPLTLATAAALPARVVAVLVPVLPAAAFVAPELWLARRARKRAARAARDLPALLDLLRVALAAGSPPLQAIALVGASGEGELAGAWAALARRVERGLALTDALAQLAKEFPQPEVVGFVGALERALRHGTPLEDVLEQQATRARELAARRLREEAARAGPKIQLVVALLLVPSVLIVVLAAVLRALLASRGLLLPAT